MNAKNPCFRLQIVFAAGLALIPATDLASGLSGYAFHGLPYIIVDVSGHEITECQHVISVQCAYRDPMVHSLAQVSIRGSSSAKREKKPYRLELQDEHGDDLKLSLLDMPKESDWIMYPAYTDKTMIRDVLAYELWRQMGYWAPRTRYVHLFIKTNCVLSVVSRQLSVVGRKSSVGSGQLENEKARAPDGMNFSGPEYQGVYVLMEKIKRDKHRVNIEKLPRALPPTFASFAPSSSNDISGGYIFKKDRHNNTNETHFITSKKVDLLIEEPKAQHLTAEQHGYLTNYINEFETVLFSDGFADPETGYRRYVDIDSFIDYHWMQELAKNSDAYWFSEFYHKDRGGKIKIGPIWDFDMCFGNTWYNKGHETNDWRWSRSAAGHYRWYKRMFKDPEFLQRYIDRWSELRTNVLSNSNILALIDRYAAELAEAQKLNYQRWPTLGKKVGPVKHVGQ